MWVLFLPQVNLKYVLYKPFKKNNFKKSKIMKFYSDLNGDNYDG